MEEVSFRPQRSLALKIGLVQDSNRPVLYHSRMPGEPSQVLNTPLRDPNEGWNPLAYGRYGARTKTANGEIKIPEFLAATDDTRAGIMEQHREARKSTMSDIANDQRKFRKQQIKLKDERKRALRSDELREYAKYVVNKVEQRQLNIRRLQQRGIT